MVGGGLREVACVAADRNARNLPLVVLTRAERSYKDGEADVQAAQLEKEWKEDRRNSPYCQPRGHNMELEAPDEVVAAIRDVVEMVRHAKPWVMTAPPDPWNPSNTLGRDFRYRPRLPRWQYVGR
jgi:hypothetical protein